MLYFLRFCSVVGIDAEQFGAREEDGGLTLSEEEEVLALFATYVVHHPRKNHKLLNAADYAACCLSAVRCWVKDHHRRSPGADPRHSLLLTRALAGLQKLSPSGIREPRAPILQIHMRAIRSRLDLEGNASIVPCGHCGQPAGKALTGTPLLLALHPLLTFPQFFQVWGFDPI